MADNDNSDAPLPEEGTALTAPAPAPKPPIVASENVLAIIPQNFDEAWRYAEMVFKSGTAPESYDNDPKKIIIGVLAALELGVPPMTGLRGIAIINKKPAVWGDLAVALCQAKRTIKSFESNYTGIEGEDDYTANVVIWRVGQDFPYEGHFSIKDAKRAGLWMNPKKDPWIKYPYRMLFNRARAFALRDGFADCLAGLAIVEEARDLAHPAPEPVNTAFLTDDTPAITDVPDSAEPIDK